MKNFIQKFAGYIMAFVMSIGMIAPAISATPVHAATSGESGAAILTGCWSKGENSKNGAGIICVINLVIDILAVLVGIVGVIGIVIVGIQYLTAGGNEEQTRKAKRRLFEIIIGIVAYVLVYAFLKWLLPGFESSGV